MTNFYNLGWGKHAILTFSTNEEAQACVAALNKTEVAGRTIKMNITKN